MANYVAPKPVKPESSRVVNRKMGVEVSKQIQAEKQETIDSTTSSLVSLIQTNMANVETFARENPGREVQLVESARWGLRALADLAARYYRLMAENESMRVKLSDVDGEREEALSQDPMNQVTVVSLETRVNELEISLKVLHENLIEQSKEIMLLKDSVGDSPAD